ncbi:MAG: ATP-binding protein [Coriobacteriia bacterium]|nr:ATP-binding protein [Coriobacteriia bacterium]
MIIKRQLQEEIEKRLFDRKAIIVLGARQVGKTTLLNTMLASRNDVLWLNGDLEDTHSLIDKTSPAHLKTVIGRSKILVIDEAQRIENIGLKLKVIQDAYGKDLQIIATGSSAFELANEVNEPMTGRKWEYTMFPLSFSEMYSHHGYANEVAQLENRLLFGYYPDVVTHPADSKEVLLSLSSDNLYKDIYRWGGIKKTVQFENLVKALAFQIGSQVSINELSLLTGLDNKTVNRYLTLLEQAFVIFRLGSYSGNLRNELKHSSKYFFYDVGIRNAVINDFRPTNLRPDIGGLFENFVIAELIKTKNAPSWFWRTTQKQEVDYLEESDGAMMAVEIKWNPKANARITKTFRDAYKPAETYKINRENYANLLLARTPQVLQGVTADELLESLQKGIDCIRTV